MSLTDTFLMLLNGGTLVTPGASACPVPVLEVNFLLELAHPKKMLGCLHRLDSSSSQPRHMTKTWPITEAPLLGPSDWSKDQHVTYRDAYLERLVLETGIAELCYENLVFSGGFLVPLWEHF